MDLNEAAELASKRPGAEAVLHFWLDRAEQTPRWGWAEMVLLLAWCAVVAGAVRQHWPWADEMQAWLLAGGASWKMLFGTSLHYEGTGGLWHALLKLLQQGGISYWGMRWVAAGAQGVGMLLLLGYAPFPRAVRYLLPFTFFLLYQDGVVARSYCLFAALAFAAAALLCARRPRPLLLALLLGLMANVSLHGAVASGGLALTALWVWRGRLAQRAPAALLLVGLWAAAVTAMTPARDVDFDAGNNIQRSVAKAKEALGLKGTPPPPAIAGLPMAGLTPAPVRVNIRHGEARLWNKLARVLGVVTYPLSSSPALALLLVGCVVAQAWMPGEGARSLGWAGLLPYGLVVAVFATVYLAPRHAGMVLTAFVVSAWLTWPQASLRGPGLWLARGTAVLFALVCLGQVLWTLHALAQERRLPYGPGRMTAGYLQGQGVGAAAGGKELAGYYYYSIDPLLYFASNLYLNQPPHRYWDWSTRQRNRSTVWQVLDARPRFIIVGGFEGGPDGEITRDWRVNTLSDPAVVLGDGFGVVRFFEAHGYGKTHVFCGHSWMRGSYAELLCDTVLEPVGR